MGRKEEESPLTEVLFPSSTECFKNFVSLSLTLFLVAYITAPLFVSPCGGGQKFIFSCRRQQVEVEKFMREKKKKKMVQLKA